MPSNIKLSSFLCDTTNPTNICFILPPTPLSPPPTSWNLNICSRLLLAPLIFGFPSAQTLSDLCLSIPPSLIPFLPPFTENKNTRRNLLLSAVSLSYGPQCAMWNISHAKWVSFSSCDGQPDPWAAVKLSPHFDSSLSHFIVSSLLCACYSNCATLKAKAAHQPDGWLAATQPT